MARASMSAPRSRMMPTAFRSSRWSVVLARGMQTSSAARLRSARYRMSNTCSVTLPAAISSAVVLLHSSVTGATLSWSSIT